MLISPSIASSDLLHLEEETVFAAHHFGQIHIDIEDGTIDVSNCNQDVLNSAQADGGLYALCNGINAPALLYNKTLLDENGITVKDNMTMDEFIALSKEIQKKTGYKTNLCYNQNEQFLEYYLRADDIVLYQDGKLGGDSADPYINFFKLYEDGIKDGWVVDPSVFAERTIGSVEQDPLVYGSSPETMSWCSFSYSNQLTAIENAGTTDREAVTKAIEEITDLTVPNGTATCDGQHDLIHNINVAEIHDLVPEFIESVSVAVE